jgi:hypothetical protein
LLYVYVFMGFFVLYLLPWLLLLFHVVYLCKLISQRGFIATVLFRRKLQLVSVRHTEERVVTSSRISVVWCLVIKCSSVIVTIVVLDPVTNSCVGKISTNVREIMEVAIRTALTCRDHSDVDVMMGTRWLMMPRPAQTSTNVPLTQRTIVISTPPVTILYLHTTVLVTNITREMEPTVQPSTNVCTVT